MVKRISGFRRRSAAVTRAVPATQKLRCVHNESLSHFIPSPVLRLFLQGEKKPKKPKMKRWSASFSLLAAQLFRTAMNGSALRAPSKLAVPCCNVCSS